MGRNSTLPCDEHGKKNCWDCGLHRYRKAGHKRRVKLEDAVSDEIAPEIEVEPKPICGCGRDYLQVPLDDPHQDCPNPIYPDQDEVFEAA